MEYLSRQSGREGARERESKMHTVLLTTASATATSIVINSNNNGSRQIKNERNEEQRIVYASTALMWNEALLRTCRFNRMIESACVCVCLCMRPPMCRTKEKE